MRPGCTGGTEQWEGHSGLERERERCGSPTVTAQLGVGSASMDWAAPDMDTEAWRRRRSALGPASAQRLQTRGVASDTTLEASDKRCRRAAFTCGKQAMR
jgi:hypothetical protein